MKRLISFIGIVAVMVVVLGLGYYFRYQGGGPAGVVTEGSSEYPVELPESEVVPAGNLPGTGTGLPAGTKFGAVSEDEAAGYAALADAVYLVRTDGQVVKISGKAREVISGGLLADVVGAWFSVDAQKVVVGYGGSRAPKFSLFDIPSKSWRQLDGIESPAWSPSDARLAYISKLGGARRLVTLDAADPKAQPVLLTDLRIEDATLAWPAPGRILIGERSGARYEGSAWLFDIKAGTLRRIVEDRLGAEVLWSFAGNRGVLFRTDTNQRGGDLFILDDTGREVKKFDILTLPEKCIFSHSFVSSTPPEAAATTTATSTKAKTKPLPPPPPKLVESLWCAMPRDQAALDRWTLPDEYNMGMFTTADDIYEIDIDSGAITSPAASPSAFDAVDLSRAADRVYFRNRTDGRVYFLQIEKQNPS